MRRFSRFLGAVALLSLLAACGGGGNDAGGGGNAPPPPPPPPVTGIGAAGGTVSDPSGAKVVVPAGALTTNIDIAVAQSSDGAPPMPADVTALGQIFAFTPHGTTFASPVTITVPFDPTKVPAGMALTLFKTDATRTAWIEIPGATVSGSTMSGQVSGFSNLFVGALAPTDKSWIIEDVLATGKVETQEVGEQVGGALVREFVFGGALPVKPPSYPVSFARGVVTSNVSGRTFSSEAVAPHPFALDPTTTTTSAHSLLTQVLYFEVNQESPTLRFVITVAHLESIDNGGNAPSRALCPWLGANPTPEQLHDRCDSLMSEVNGSFRLEASSLVDHGTFFSIGGEVNANGVHQHWEPAAYGIDGVEQALWSDADFDFEVDADHDGTGRHFTADLLAHKVVEIPIQHLHLHDVFAVEVTAETLAGNSIQGESFIGASLRDPVSSSGVEIATTGLTQIPPRDDIPTGFAPISCATGVDPAAGVLQFTQTTFETPELSPRPAVLVERTGGTVGAVSVRVQTRDASALAGDDYKPISTVVRFANGDGGARVIHVPLVNDTQAEDDETVDLVLSDVGGCSQLGTQSTATLSILDDDRPLPPPATHTVSGTVTGLTGSGLVLKELTSGGTVAASNGAFSLPGALADGTHYDIRVDTQPSNPTQQCTVTNGAGTISGADVSNVQVACTSPAPSGALDPQFGSGGRVATNVAYAPGVSNARIGMALQSDGKILLVGGLTLLRFNADGTLDTSFGTGGQVHVPFNGGVFDTAQDVAAQADGKIIVVGFTGTAGASDDFALVRFNADGTLDSSFGTGGKANTDFAGSADRARRVYIQPDGKLLVTGFATFIASPTVASETFALARYNADGSLDTTFAAGGKAHDSPGGSFAYAQGLAIQSDGKIVVVGAGANDGVSDPDVGLVRYLGDTGLGLPGWRDETFGELGNGVVNSNLHLATGWEEADDVVIAADGTLMLAGRVRAGVAVGGSDFGFVLVTFGSDGRQKGGALITKFTNLSDNARAMALQSDGKIVVVGQSGNLSSNPDMAIVRYTATGLSYDTDFGTDGKLSVDFFGGIDGAEAIAQQPDGKLVIGGFARFNGQTRLALIRLLP